MFSKPCIMDRLEAVHTSFKLDFEFRNNITMLIGDSGVGKTVIFSILQEAAVENPQLFCMNYLDIHRDILGMLKHTEGKLIVIDNADILLASPERKWIALDSKNQYLIIGRNPANLLTTSENLYELVSEQQDGMIYFTIRNAFSIC